MRFLFGCLFVFLFGFLDFIGFKKLLDWLVS